MFQQPAENTGEKVPMAELVGIPLSSSRSTKSARASPPSSARKKPSPATCTSSTARRQARCTRTRCIFQGALIGSLKGAVGGDPVLGRVGLGVKKPGQNAPYILMPFTAQDAVIATAYIQRLPQPFQAPSATQAAAPVAAQPVLGRSGPVQPATRGH